jgi:hypothetical protein
LIDSKPSPPSQLLASNYQACAKGHDSDQIALDWAEYEFLRHCHFALELLLAALTDQLAISGDSSVDEIVTSWASAAPSTVTQYWPTAVLAWKGTGAAAMATVPANLFFGEPMTIEKLRDQTPSDRALTSFALLCALSKQSDELRRHSKFGERGRADQNPIKIIETAGATPFSTFMINLLQSCVVGPHLATTLRKMGAGQKCSLRFFPEGPKLRATGIPVLPNQSGDRLTNVIRILADVGIFRRTDSGYVLENDEAR